MKKKQESDLMLGTMLTCFGIMFMFIALFLHSQEIIIFSFTLGAGLIGFGLALLFNLIRVTEKLFKQRKAALYIWAVCLLAISVLSLGWFVLTWPTYQIITYIESVYTFPPEATNAITLIKNVIAWFLILMALGLLLWAYVMSQKREEVTFPVG